MNHNINIEPAIYNTRDVTRESENGWTSSCAHQPRHTEQLDTVNQLRLPCDPWERALCLQAVSQLVDPDDDPMESVKLPWLQKGDGEDGGDDYWDDDSFSNDKEKGGKMIRD
ncbi:hypothetical protein LOAG_03221 [Loa loa]|uniref:Uncharacterized protein n=1 Tax=Loa loa TaxID=7209 RepID=A0A1S0U585_LOALO|nr:hypothetical protein LOAG_03221 [Loa loa]EFO25261.1 hypothetical protein LOAG_03221 [Loa loa]